MPDITRNTRPLLVLALALAALTQLSCASSGLAPAPHSQPVERMGLLPEYRIFYDALQGQGDWVYIQPAGYVFRPNVNFITWRPYEDGFWAPSDLYGWTWISAEPFGWATYHYGTWAYDRYYGWVWAPGRDWGPAWVTWQVTADYAGWSPLLTPGSASDAIRGGPWTYAPLGALGSTNLTTRVVHESDLGERVQDARRVENLAERGGVVFNRGPKFDLVEKQTGSLQRVTLEPLDLEGVTATPRTGEAKSMTKGAAKPGAAPPPAAIETVRKAADEDARAARTLADRAAPLPGNVRIIRPGLPPASRSTAAKGAAADTTAR